MVACNIFRCANILLTILIILPIVNVSCQATTKSPKKNGTVVVAAKNGSMPMTMLPRKQVLEEVAAYRLNAHLVAGYINMTISTINLLFALLNFYLIFGRYKARLLQISGKLSIAVEELTNRDLHPKIKMGLAREVEINSPLLDEIFALMKEPSPLFDDANGLFEGQKEARIRRTMPKEQPGENKDDKGGKMTKTGDGQSMATPADDTKSTAKSQVSDMKKNK